MKFLQNTRLMRKFEEIPWYELSVQKQRDYVHILNRLQDKIFLKIGPFGELNFHSFVAVMFIIYFLYIFLYVKQCVKKIVVFSQMTNKMYSFFMMLLNVMD